MHWRDRLLNARAWLALLLRRQGPPPETPPEHRDLDPSWGPVGSLLAKLDPQQLEPIHRQHADMLALERSRRAPDAAPAEPPSAPPPPPKPTPRPAQTPPARRTRIRASDW